MKTKLTLIILIASSGLFAQDDPYAARRAKIFEEIGDDVAIIKNTGKDYVLPMNVNWNFYYLTGIETEGAVLVLDGKNKTYHIFDDGKPTKEFKETKKISPLIHKMRSIKDDHEMELLTHAIQTTAAGLVNVMKTAEPGMNEKDFELILLNKFKKEGCEHLGFGIQAASGPNSTHVHYGKNNRDTENGDMMVFDVGARSGFYSADISRSFPVSGKFTKEQAEIYSIVLKAQKAAIAEMKPGVNIGIASKAALDVLNEGLAELGLITDLESSWQKKFWIQHGFFHHIGLVVHDVGGYNNDLEPGMIITMEPGLYFPKDYLEKGSSRRLRGVSEEEKEEFIKTVTPIFEKYINIGVRIEDDVYITKDGNKIISSGVPKEIEEIEALMK